MRIKPDFTILVPLINTNAHFFFGEERFRDFTVYIATRMGEKIPNDEKDLKHLEGRSWYGGVWVKDIKDTSTLVHEIYHLTANIATSMEVESEEIKARINEYLYTYAMKKIAKLAKNEKSVDKEKK